MTSEQMRALLESPRAEDRVAGLDAVAEAGAGEHLPRVVRMLGDDAPYVFRHGPRRMIAEVRTRALVTLEKLYALTRRRPDFGPVLVRKAMPVESAERRAREALAALDTAAQAEVESRAADHLFHHVRPRPEDHATLLAYRVLQELGQVPYLREEVDPITYRTPLQAAVEQSQLQSDRPRPHLRVRDPRGETLGFVYRTSDGRLALDFSEGREAEEAMRWIRRVLSIEPRGLPRVRHADDTPVTNPDGSFALDGVVPLNTAEPADLLRSLRAFVAKMYPAELVL